MEEGAERRPSSRIDHENLTTYKLDTLQYRDQKLALLITGERGTKFDWDRFKWTPTEPEEEGIVSTASGNDYYIYTDWQRTYIVNTRESERKGQLVAAYSKGIKARLPEITFGEPWRIPGFYTTTEIESILLKYKIGDIGDKIDEPIPFEKYRHYFRRPAS
jgi:hypothetical protein